MKEEVALQKALNGEAKNAEPKFVGNEESLGDKISKFFKAED